MVDGFLLLELRHVILDDLLDNILCHVEGFPVAVAELRGVARLIGVGDLGGGLDDIVLGDDHVVLLLGILKLSRVNRDHLVDVLLIDQHDDRHDGCAECEYQQQHRRCHSELFGALGHNNYLS